MQVVCKQCSTPFDKNIGEIHKSPNHFCSRSCAAKFNNKLKPKRRARFRKCFCGNLST